LEFSLAKTPKKLNQLIYMARVQGLKPKPNHLRPNLKVWFSILAELNSEFSLSLTKNALNQTKLNFGSTTSAGLFPVLLLAPLPVFSLTLLLLSLTLLALSLPPP